MLSSCAHRGAPRDLQIQQEPDEVLAQICSAGETVAEASGVVQIRAQSPEASGQFPASVQVNSQSRTLDLEVTNPLGGTEAKIRVEGTNYQIEAGRGKKARQEKGTGTWGGIPLHWAVDLFLGRFPCPSKTEHHAKIESGNVLVVRVPPSLAGGEEIFRYSLDIMQSDRKVWPKSLQWSRSGILASEVKFQFSSPEDATRSPMRWEAVSSRGEVKAKWREREVRQFKGEGRS